MLKAKPFIFLFAVLLLSFGSNAQEKQYKHVFAPADFLRAPDINDKSEEVYPLYNRTYDTLLFVRSHHFDNIGGNKDNFDIWYSYKNAGGAWSTAQNLRELNNSHNNSIVGLGQVTNALFLVNSYTSHHIRDQGISFSTLEDGKWNKPVPVEFSVDTHNRVYSFFINHTEDIIMITLYNNLSEGHEDLFVSLKSEDGRWREPIYLGHDVNSEGYETSPFLLDDKKTLFFTSNGFNGYGDGDIYMTKRLDDTWIHWTKPENLGKGVNSEKFDGYFSLYPNGTYLLASNRHAEYADIFTGTWELEEVMVDPEDVVDSVIVKEVIKEKSLIEAMPDIVRVTFDFNSSKFSTDSYGPELDNTINFLSTHPNVGLVVEGNTDRRGDDLFNLILSHKRATGVANYLKSKLPSEQSNRVLVIPNGEVNATDDDASSRVVLVKYVLLNSN